MKAPQNLASDLADRLVGQSAAISAIVPAIRMYEAGLCPGDRPVAVFLLVGPTGTGKTKTVEALADVLHGSPKSLIRVDCGEFQHDQEIAKLLGSPPGWLGHRETSPILNQTKLQGIKSRDNDLSLVLFDEIEKAGPAMERLLLGVLDKGKLGLGDNNQVNFDRTVVFMTSNLGGNAMSKAAGAGFGLEAYTGRPSSVNARGIALNAIKRRFSPEFVNRIDSIVTYQMLSAHALAGILDRQLVEVRLRLALGERKAQLEVPPRTKHWLLANGTSAQYGARELKRTLQRELVQPLANAMLDGNAGDGTIYRAELNRAGDGIVFREKAGK